jgi:hypothetical protein
MVEFVLRVQVKGSGKGQMHVMFLDEQNKATGETAAASFAVGADYQRRDLLLQVPPDTVKLRIHLGAKELGSTVLFDKLEVLEPAAAMN